MTLDKALLVLAALVPAAILLAALNWRGRPWPMVLTAVALGGLAGFPAYWTEKLLTIQPWEFHNFGVLFVFAMVVAGMVEESCKFVAYWLWPGRKWATEEYDGILFAGSVSLGFAAVENVLYVTEGGMETAWVRAFTAIPLHAACGVVMGSYLGAAIARKKVGWTDGNLPLTGLLAAVALHGVYDVVAFTDANLISTVLLALVLISSGAWCLARARAARRRSPSYGGRALPLPPPIWTWPKRIGPAPVVRNPYLAGALGLIPGLGQAYNGDRPKALIFFAIGVFNLGLYWMVHFLMYEPEKALDWMMYAGVLPAVMVRPEEFALAIEQKWMLVPILLSMVVCWEVVGAVDAYLTARHRARSPQQHSVRRSMASHGFGSSYVVHLAVVLMLVFVPLLRESAGVPGTPGETNAEQKKGDKEGGGQPAGQQQASGQDWNLTWVGVPVKLDGFEHGDPQGEGDARVGESTDKSLSRGPGVVVVKPGKPGKEPRGKQEVSYNEYLSGQIRYNDGDQHYFRSVPSTVWTIIEYRILKDGTLASARLVDTNGTREQGERAVDVIRNAAPFLELPGDVSSIQVLELFWSQNIASFEPGTLQAELSNLPDGRRIRPDR